MSTLVINGYQSAVWIDVNSDYNLYTGGEILLDQKAVNGSLRNLLRCRVGSRRMLREYGTYLVYYLHEPLTQLTADSLFSSLMQSIRKWEPRINVVENASSIEIDKRLPGFKLDIQYTILKTNTSGFFQFSVKKM